MQNNDLIFTYVLQNNHHNKQDLFKIPDFGN